MKWQAGDDISFTLWKPRPAEMRIANGKHHIATTGSGYIWGGGEGGGQKPGYTRQVFQDSGLRILGSWDAWMLLPLLFRHRHRPLTMMEEDWCLLPCPEMSTPIHIHQYSHIHNSTHTHTWLRVSLELGMNILNELETKLWIRYQILLQKLKKNRFRGKKD